MEQVAREQGNHSRYSCISCTGDRVHIASEMFRLIKGSPTCLRIQVLASILVLESDRRRTNYKNEVIVSLLYILQTPRCFGILSAICQKQISRILQTCKILLKQHVDVYFMHIHPWIPFLSKRNILGQVLSPLSGHRLDHSILLTAIKLIIATPGDDARSEAYCEIKTALLDAELKGILTLRLLQAIVLVALYELGHAIYPSAYLTVGYCAKYGIALGINRTIDPNCGVKPSMADSEEERRTWWAILLLDRLMNVGCPERAPVTEEPDGTSTLPMDGHLWDTGVKTTNTESNWSPTLSSLPTGAMGRFALTVQAAFLLDRVLRNGRAPIDENGFQEEEARILDKAILALTQVSLQESEQRGMGLCSPTTICHSARLILNNQMLSWLEDPSDHVTDIENLLEVRRTIASDMLGLAQTLNRTGLCGREESSPFCHDAMYRSALIYGQLSQRMATPDIQRSLDEIQKGLKANNRRWKAAGAYVKLIQARVIAGIL